MSNQQTYRVRTQAELEEALQRFIDHAWQKPTGPLFHIPVDLSQDADCILMDGIKELIALRARVQEREAELAASRRVNLQARRKFMDAIAHPEQYTRLRAQLLANEAAFVAADRIARKNAGAGEDPAEPSQGEGR